MVFDCGAVPANLIESELFGHERGAFTGAHAEHAGRVRARRTAARCSSTRSASCRSSCSPGCCARSTTARFGASAGRRTALDVRIVAATNRDLGALVAAKQFRQDLYFRLAAAVVHLAAAARPARRPAAARAAAARAISVAATSPPDATLDALRAHSWPGNVRELKNVLACALAFVEPGAP